MKKELRVKVLYITYLGLIEPIPKSQVLPYLFDLSRDVDIHLLSFEKKWLIKKENDEFKKIQNTLQNNGIMWHRLTYHKYPLLLSSVLDIFLGSVISLFIVLRYRISIVHARSNVPIAIGYALRSVLPIKLLYDRRGIMGEDHTEHSGWKREGYLHRLATWFEKKVIRKSDAIVVLTQRANDQLKKSMNSNRNISIETIPCCINLRLFNLKNNQDLKDEIGLSDKFVFVYSGSVGTYNLLEEMFDFFKEALKLIPAAHFLILTQNKDAVLSLIEKRTDIEKDRIIISYIPQEKLSDFLSIGDVGLVFRRTSPTAIAASPTKFGEYLACGLPVVSTPQIGDLKEIIASNNIGVVLNGYTQDDYKEAVNSLLLLLREKEEVRKRCRKIAEDFFSLERGARTYLDIYNRLVNI